MEPYFSNNFYNPSANYLAAKEVKKEIELARGQVASIIGSKPNEIVFTAGGTEANNLAIAGVMKSYPKANLVISTIEHPSIYEPATNFNTKLCKVDKYGLIDLDQLSKTIDDSTVLVSIMYVNNEIGVIEPLSNVSRLIKQIREDRQNKGIKLPIYFHTDACQASNYLDLHASRLGVDLMTLNGGKIYGPKQSGALFVKSDVKLSPLIYGGGQERALRSGTENVASIIGFSHALELAQTNHKTNAAKITDLQKYFIQELTTIPGTNINGSLTKRIANNIHVTFKGIDNEWLLIKLDDLGIMAASGSACSAAKLKPSTVLSAIGLTDQDARSSIRLSLGSTTTKQDIDLVIKALRSLIDN